MENTFERSRVNFVSKVMTNMGLGLFVTFVIAYFVSTSQTMLSLIFSSGFTVILLFLIEIGLVIYLTRRIGDMSLSQARFSFLVYAAVNGLTLSVIFIAYNIFTIYTVFLIAALMFVISGLIGISIRKDLSGMAHFFLLALIGIIIASVANMFLRIPSLDFAISIIGVILFSGLTAFDMQRIKTIHYNAYNYDAETVGKYSIIGALTLYLDFINLFLYLLRIFGKKR